VSEYPNLFEKMCEVASLVRHGGTHTARMVIADQPLPLAWPLMGGLEFSSDTRPRIEACVGAVVVATKQQPDRKALCISTASIWLCRRFSSRGLALRSQHGATFVRHPYADDG
jgi:hypothetical protein